MKPQATLLAATITGAFAFAPIMASACAVPGTINAMVSGVFSGLNAERRKAGLALWKYSAALSQAAQDHACDSGKRDAMTHVGSNGSSLTSRLKAAGYRYRDANENLARARASTNVVAIWMNSSSHRANILSQKTTEVGIGLAFNPDGTALHWVMNSGNR